MPRVNAAREQSFFTRDGKRILDFLSGYCVHNTGHNHPHIVQALKDELDSSGPAMLQSHEPELARELAQRLCELAGGGLGKVYFGSSGSEGVEAAIKFARATTGRPGIVYAQNSFHGLTVGALSLMNDEFWRNGFGPFLRDAVGLPFGDLAALERALSGMRPSSWSRCRPKAKFRCRHARTCKWLRNCATSTVRCTFWMKSRPECIEQERSWQRTNSS